MTTKYKNVPMVLDVKSFVKDVTRCYEELIEFGDYDTEREISVVVFDYSENWLSSVRSKALESDQTETENRIISMSRLLDVCNTFGLDPRRYFVLEDGE